MIILKNQPLASYSSMRLGGKASYLCEVANDDDVIEAASFAKSKKVPLITIGDGTNLIFKDHGYPGLVIVNKLKGLNINGTEVKARAGENWDSLVALTVKNNLSGVEALSLIPGTVGGAPVNNIGAYGQEIKDSLLEVEAFDTTSHQFVVLNNKDCHFSYRNSIFKNQQHGKYIITSVSLNLKKTLDYKPPEYSALINELKTVIKPTLSQVRQAVITIRSSKLPDPHKIANSGSFFKNPFVHKDKFKELQKKYLEMPHYPVNSDTVKVPAGWLIDQAGLKGKKMNGMWVYDKQALVLVNESASSYNDLEKTYSQIQELVDKKFGISLEIEPEIL